MKTIDADKLKAEIKLIQQSLEHRDVRLNQVKKIRTECMIELCKRILDVIDSLQQEQPNNMIQWTGNNLREVVEFTGKSPKFGEWFKSWEELETYVHQHNDILKLFCEDGSHFEVPAGAWIVKTPDGYNVPSVARFVHAKQEQPYKSFCEENCKGYRDTGGKCFFGLNCSARKAQKQPGYGYIRTEYVPGEKSRWKIGDTLAYYINTSNEEGEYVLGKIVNIEPDEDEGWLYTFENEDVWDEETLIREGAYEK